MGRVARLRAVRRGRVLFDRRLVILPWKKLDAVREPSGGELVLWQRGHEFSIRIDGQDLMGSGANHSERVLAERGCAGLMNVPRARVLVGGLGMGFTLRAALDALGRDAEVDVAELVPQVVVWNRGLLAHLAQRPLEDPRVFVLEDDVGRVLAAAQQRYDAILLDVDNGPEALVSASNSSLYGPRGISRAWRALRPQGVLAVWSVRDDRRFTTRLRAGGFRTRTERVSARPDGSGSRHTLWLAERMQHQVPPPPQRPR
jgi:spermidine synthase